MPRRRRRKSHFSIIDERHRSVTCLLFGRRRSHQRSAVSSSTINGNLPPGHMPLNVARVIFLNRAGHRDAKCVDGKTAFDELNFIKCCVIELLK